MQKATAEVLNNFNSLFEERKEQILNTKTYIKIKGTAYYVSNNGDDNNDGLTPKTAWKTLNKVTTANLNEGDGVFFERGNLFRGKFTAQNGVTYSAYGQGEKPKFYAHDKPLTNPLLWELYDEEYHIWKLKEKILDVGTIVFNDGEYHSRKLIPSYKNSTFVCRETPDEIFDIYEQMTCDLDLFWHYDDRHTITPSKNENFPIPLIDDQSFGDLYLRCDKGNPAKIFTSIEALTRVYLITARQTKNVTIDNLCIKYAGMHAVAAGGPCENLTVTNCEMGWIGGCIQHYYGTDPNYPEGKRGSVTRFGNAIEIYGACNGYTVCNNYIYQVYDAGITHQVTTSDKKLLKNIEYSNNLVEKCVYGIEYFLDQINGENESQMENVLMSQNFIRLSGYGWGQQRHNKETPALIKGWSYVNTAKNFRIEDNIFDRCAYRMVHLVAERQEFCPTMCGNTYIQNLGMTLGQYGGKENGEPPILPFDNKANETIENIFGEKNAKVYYIE
ncbi:MAG: hypothetical protein E7537_02075 [Ruminococcaceae bacterium]|nr:hypothetical protein [Oscillospiraceae bacterium]